MYKILDTLSISSFNNLSRHFSFISYPFAIEPPNSITASWIGRITGFSNFLLFKYTPWFSAA